VPVGRILADPKVNLFTAWNGMSRVDVVEGGHGRAILIDAGTAVTRLARPGAPLATLGPDGSEEGFFVRGRPGARVLVIGSGGGREVLLALRNGAGQVAAVEVNPAIQRIVTSVMAGYTGRLYDDPRVEPVTDEARSWLRRGARSFDFIHLPHTISNAALASGSVSLAEDYVLTLEAFEDYFEHLAPGGVLLITRPEAHLPRLVSTLRAAAARRGDGDLAPRVLAWKKPGAGLSFYAGIAVSNRPFTAEEAGRFARTLEARGLEPLALPGSAAEPYRSLLAGAEPAQVPLGFPAILEPATDERPFFNRRVALSGLRWRDLAGVFSRGHDARAALEDRPVAEAALLVVSLQVALLALLFVGGPLVLLRRRGGASAGSRARLLLPFAGTGLGFMLLEVGFIQRFTLYLGSPLLVFAVVLGAVLLSSGLGSFFSGRLGSGAAPRVLLLVVLAGALSMPLAAWLTGATLALPAAARIGLAVAVIAPAGFLMGMPFPLLIRAVEASGSGLVPWAWGVNAVASVVGSVAAVGIDLAVGHSGACVAGLAAYAIAAFAAWRWARSPVTEAGVAAG
jgi:SAM-dependent methyltransferase